MEQQRQYAKIFITEKSERSIRAGHPWVYGAEITRREGACQNGGLVDVLSSKGRYLGTGFINGHSKIQVRLISRNANDRFDTAFWERRLRHAIAYRKTVMGADFDCCRLIFGEADFFPGLTVDRFHNLLVTQTLSLGIEQRKDLLFPLLLRILREEGETIDAIYERNDVAIRTLEGLEQGAGFYPPVAPCTDFPSRIKIVENGLSYWVDYQNGQKTGYFLDQKYNRQAVAVWRQAGMCWTASPTRGRSLSMRRMAAPPACTQWIFPQMPFVRLPGTHSSTGWRIASPLRPSMYSTCCQNWLRPAAIPMTLLFWTRPPLPRTTRR